MDVRVIAASNHHVKQEIEMGRFSPDLLYRTNAFTIHLPLLRDRREDIFSLREAFAKQGAFCEFFSELFS
jgi:DNA-binding NtrC family response regulator